MAPRQVAVVVALLAIVVPPVALGGAEPARAQVSAEAPVAVPGFWDPRRRPERPDRGSRSRIDGARDRKVRTRL